MKKIKKNNDCVLGIRIHKDFKKSYIDYCNKYGYGVSKRLKLFIERDMKGEIYFKEI